MRTLLGYLLGTLFVVGFPAALVGQQTIAEATAVIRAEFARLDLNSDRQLDRAEFLQCDPNADRRVLERDFVLYDFDRSNALSATEFATVSGLVPPALRGRIPDPFDDLVEAAVAALDESYEGWNQRPGELVNAHTFVANFLGSISPGSKLFVTGRILRQADQDADGRLSRTEARRFLQQQLGFHWYDGPALREDTGRLVRFDWFLEVDTDQSGSLTRDEFVNRWWNQTSVDDDFQSKDRDGNGQISFSEFAHPDSTHYFDPIEWFRGADRNLDAMLDAEEMFAASDPARGHLVSSSFSGFDSDRDGRLSLSEYRLTMHANVNFNWSHRPLDDNRDGHLSYDEFIFHPYDLFHLQRRYFFHRLDRDADGLLSRREFNFQSRSPDGVHLGSTGGGASRLLYRNPDYPRCGWPVVSPDGATVLFHRQQPDDRTTATIVSVDVESGEATILIDGRQPSWSRDGERFVCSRRTDRHEVWIVSATGEPLKTLGPGSSAKWSPDGRLIGWLHDNGLWIHDVADGTTRPLLQRDGHDYQDLGDDLTWSPDSRHVVVAARKPNDCDVVMMAIDGTSQSVIFQSKPNHRIEGHLGWSRREGLLFCLRDRLGDTSELVSLAPGQGSEPTAIGWLNPDQRWKSACVSPDGMWYTAIMEE